MRCDTHLGLDRPPLRRALRGAVMPRFYGLFDACLAVGSRNAEFYRRHGVTDDDIFLVPYAVDNHRFREGARAAMKQPDESRRALGLPPPEVPVVLLLSKLTPQKRPLDLLRAFEQVRGQHEVPLALAIVGEGPERPRIEAFVDQHEIPDVHLLGFRNQSELPEIYGACDVFVLPSENESWGLVVNEAMAAGLPVVVSDGVGAAEDLLEDGSNGFVYPVGDVAELADRLGRLAGDAGYRKKMGANSLAIISDWSIRAGVDAVRTALHSVAKAAE